MTIAHKSHDARQRGTAAIEFALVFTIIWAVFWSMVCYVMPLIVAQTLHRAVAEGARAAAMVTSTAEARGTQAQIAAQNEINRAFLPASLRNAIAVTPDCDTEDAEIPASAPATACMLHITATIAYRANSPFTPFSLPGIGQIPTMPETLTATSNLLLL